MKNEEAVRRAAETIRGSKFWISGLGNFDVADTDEITHILRHAMDGDADGLEKRYRELAFLNGIELDSKDFPCDL